ncbi:MAG: hypothetical protein P8P74_12475 [Crocinitomicaceae bacterium]|nr:hypothetical protein [Crocinitomicaceae bacterium]
MSKLAAFLTELSDHELRAFHHFRFNEFMKGSKEKITLEMEKRGISSPNPDEFEAQLKISSEDGFFPNRAALCPRCLSEKFYTRHEIETISYSIASFEVDADYKTCLVCHYSEGNDENAGKTTHVTAGGFLWRLLNRKR